MKVSVWDTYVEREDGKTMHFDIIVPEEMKNADKVYSFGKDYLNNKPVISKTLTSGECNFCHIEKATDDMIKSIGEKGYFIVEMENCN